MAKNLSSESVGGTQNTPLAVVFSGRLCDLMYGPGVSYSSKARKKLAEDLLVSVSAVRKWEIGSSMPEPDKIVAIADMFSVTLDWLLGRSDIKSTSKDSLQTKEGVVALPLLEDKDGCWVCAREVDVPLVLITKASETLVPNGGYLILRAPSDSMWPTIRKQELVVVNYGINHFDENEILLLCFDDHLALRRMQRRLGACAIMADNRNHYPEVLVENERTRFFNPRQNDAIGATLFCQETNNRPLDGDLKAMFASEGKSVLIIGRVIGCTRLFG